MPRGEVCAACPALPGSGGTAAAASRDRPPPRPSASRDPLVKPQRRPHRAAEQREADEHVDIPASDAVARNSGTSTVAIERGAQRIDRSRDIQVDRNRHRPDDR